MFVDVLVKKILKSLDNVFLLVVKRMKKMNL